MSRVRGKSLNPETKCRAQALLGLVVCRSLRSRLRYGYVGQALSPKNGTMCRFATGPSWAFIGSRAPEIVALERFGREI